MKLNLPTLAEMRQKPCAEQKGMPHQLVKEDARKLKAEKHIAFREAVWKRDKGRCRATGKKLTKSGTTSWDELGEVDHAYPRSLAPERIFDTSNGLLLQKRLNRLRKVACPRAPEFRMFAYEGNDDRSQPQTFVWRDEDGTVIRSTIG